jgi:hypothetical protein
MTEFGGCPVLPVAPPRFARAEQLAQQVCAAEQRRDLVSALELLAQADNTVEHALPMEGPLPRSGVPGRSRIEPRLGRLASVLVSRPVEVRCWSQPDWRLVLLELRAYFGQRRRDLAGFAWKGRAHLEGRWCDRLADFPGGRSSPLLDAFALEVVAHEAKHVESSFLNEAEVECYALQQVDRAARLLGASKGRARRLAEVAWTVLYPENTPTYRSPECRPGGALDETPGDGVWP